MCSCRRILRFTLCVMDFFFFFWGGGGTRIVPPNGNKIDDVGRVTGADILVYIL